ncbi:tRNA uracil 4-sulfurtransferase ThiI [Treponema sp.]|uniref:tRNA uracil 4-sulfurtransferase ThiI n=1 Tax=Treponema sp. TaxID=166 RepID=UPI003F052183
MKTEIDTDFYTETYLGKLGELTLKGGNIKVFENQLLCNIRLALETVDAKARLQSGRLYVHCAKNSCGAVEYALDHLIGITGWAKVQAVEKNIEAIRQAVRREGEAAKENGARTFKIDARREDKSFPLNSYQIAAETAGVLFDDGTLAVDVHKPDVCISIEVREKCYVYCSQKKTCRGLPVGVSGKGLLLLSGGIDSPVAGYRMMRRGMKVECVYFHSYPYTSEEAQQKVQTLAQIISQYGVDTHLNVISFTEVQMRIKQKAPEAYSTLMLRLCMMKAANMLAERINADCIITGESLGQVASQTIENLAVTESFAEKPLLRPLVGLDKEEIMDTANFIGTYETSILPYEDCCVLFSPKHPVLRASVSDSAEIYASMEIDSLVQKAFDERKIFRYSIRDVVGEKWAAKENC